jgi:hypothetical protein
MLIGQGKGQLQHNGSKAVLAADVNGVQLLQRRSGRMQEQQDGELVVKGGLRRLRTPAPWPSATEEEVLHRAQATTYSNEWLARERVQQGETHQGPSISPSPQVWTGTWRHKRKQCHRAGLAPKARKVTD